jgi:hypothetical protein
MKFNIIFIVTGLFLFVTSTPLTFNNEEDIENFAFDPVKDINFLLYTRKKSLRTAVPKLEYFVHQVEQLGQDQGSEVL